VRAELPRCLGLQAQASVGVEKARVPRLAMATVSKGARAGVKGDQPRAGERESSRAFERDSSKVECALARGAAVSFAGSRGNTGLGGSVVTGGFPSTRAHPGRDSGCTSWERGGASAACNALGSFARIHSAFAPHTASGESPRRLRRGHSRRWKRDALLSQRQVGHRKVTGG